MSVNQDEWPTGDYRPAAMIGRTAEAVTRRFAIPFIDKEEDGLGFACIALCKAKTEIPFALEQFFQLREPYRDTITIFCLNNAAMTDALEAALESLDVAWNEVIWLADEIAFHQYELWRQDDNGNQFLVEVAPCRVEATRRMNRLALGGHKQVYWLKRLDG